DRTAPAVARRPGGEEARARSCCTARSAIVGCVTQLDDKTDPRFTAPRFEEEAPRRKARFYPLNPRTLADAGLSETQIEGALLKALFFAGEMRGIDLAKHLKLPLQLIEPVLDRLRKQKLAEIRGGTGQGFGLSTMIYALT